ncbi:armadillo-type protein [Salix suchowensis]|nr:armadillo-type protein [Salix suchowensis]
MPIAAEEEPVDIDDDAPSRSALRIIDSLATNLPPSQVFPALRTLISRYFSSPDPNLRRAAMLALGVSVEGCSEYMTPLMTDVWPVIEAGLQDGDASVRKATCVAVSCLCEWLEEECVTKHSVLIPKFSTTSSTNISNLLWNASLASLTRRQSPSNLWSRRHRQRRSCFEGAIPAVLRAYHVSSPALFGPDGEGEETELRGITMDTIGTISEAVGKDVFRPFFPNMMTQAFQGIEMGSARLRECSFLFFGVMAGVFGEEFAPYLPSVVPPLLASCKQTEQGEENLTSKSSVSI